MKHAPSFLSLVLAFGLAGCDGEPAPLLLDAWVTVDGGPSVDSGSAADAGPPALDGAVPDAPDGAAPDAPMPDAGPSGVDDAGSTDAGASAGWSQILGAGGEHTLRGLAPVGEEMLVVGATAVAGAGGREGVFARLGADGTPRFSRTLGSSRDDVLESVVLIGGEGLASGRVDNEMTTVWFDANTGDVRRELRHGTGTLHRVVDVGGGRVLAVGGAGTFAEAILLDATADVVRHQRLRVQNGLVDQYDSTAYDGLMLGDDIVVAGRATDSGLITRYWQAMMARLRPDGTVAWTLMLRPQGQTAFRGVARMDDGDLLAVGETEAGPGTSAMFVVRVRPSGAIRWARTLGADDAVAHAYDVVVDGGRAWVVGRISGIEESRRYHGWVVEIDEDGMVVDQQAFGNEEGGQAFYEGALSADGNLLAVGYSYARADFALGLAANLAAPSPCATVVRPSFEISTPSTRSNSMRPILDYDEEEPTDTRGDVGTLRLSAFAACPVP